MKKFIFILVAVMLAVAVNAQEKHLKFMGIPLNLTITEFEKELLAKDFEPNTYINKRLKSNTCVYKGSFLGHDVEVYIYFTPNSQLVYRSKVCVSNTDEKYISNKFYNLLRLLSYAYG